MKVGEDCLRRRREPVGGGQQSGADEYDRDIWYKCIKMSEWSPLCYTMNMSLRTGGQWETKNPQRRLCWLKGKIIRDTLEDMMTSFKLVGSEDSKRAPSHSHKDSGFLSTFNSYMQTR